MKPKFLVVGHVIRAQGLEGEIEIIVLTDFPERFSPGEKYLIRPPINGLESLTVEKISSRNKNLIIKFAEIKTRSEAEMLSGHDLVIPKEEAYELPEGSYWIHDIVGLKVFTLDGKYLGEVIEVLRTGSNDVYVVRHNDKEHLIPATKEVVKDISLKKRSILIEPIPGLLE